MTMLSILAEAPQSTEPERLAAVAGQLQTDINAGYLTDVTQAEFDEIVTDPLQQQQNALETFSQKAFGDEVPEYVKELITTGLATLSINEFRTRLEEMGISLPGIITSEQQAILLESEMQNNLSLEGLVRNGAIKASTYNKLNRAGLNVKDVRILGDITPERFSRVRGIGPVTINEVMGVIGQLAPFPIDYRDDGQEPISIVTEASKGVYPKFDIDEALYLFEEFGIRTIGQLRYAVRSKLISQVEETLERFKQYSPRPDYDVRQKEFYANVINFLKHVNTSRE